MTVYLYMASPAFTAANHLLNFTALEHITDTDTVWYSGADCLRVQLTSPRPSDGEQILWNLLSALSHGRVDLDIQDAREWLDADNYDALVTALGLVKAAA